MSDVCVCMTAVDSPLTESIAAVASAAATAVTAGPPGSAPSTPSLASGTPTLAQQLSQPPTPTDDTPTHSELLITPVSLMSNI